MNELTTTTTPAADEGEPVRAIIALNPGQMVEAQRTTQTWVDTKLAAAEKDLDEADELHAQLVRRAMNPAPAKRLMDKAAKVVRYYEKAKAALAAGYYIIPPFNVQLFAIRTDRKRPNAQRTTNRWVREESARALPVGDGRYVSPQPPRMVTTERRPTAENPTREVQVFFNGDWRDELDLPVRAMKPTIIDAVGRALELKVFDALGIAPAFRTADPIIAGQIRRPDGGALTFLVAWWLDEEDL